MADRSTKMIAMAQSVESAAVLALLEGFLQRLPPEEQRCSSQLEYRLHTDAAALDYTRQLGRHAAENTQDISSSSGANRRSSGPQ